MGDPRDVHHPTRDVAAAAAGLAFAWGQAADRAFASALDRPDAYQRTSRLVAALLAALRDRGRGLAPLLEAWEGRQRLLDEVVAADDHLTVAGIDPDAAAGAAFAMRYREALEEHAAEQRLAALAAAPGDGWVVLEEQGPADGDPFVPYRRLEADPSSGRALLVTTRPDETMTACVHAVDELRLDPATGALHAPGETAAAAQEFATAADREAYVETLKHGGPIA